MSKLAAVSVTLVISAATFFVGWDTGLKFGRQEKQQIYRDIAGSSLISASSSKAEPQLREYAKAQFYYYTDRLSKKGIYMDLGPVDEKVIEGLEPFSLHADSPNAYYRKGGKAEK